MPVNPPELTLVMPAYNEGDAVEKVVRDWSNELKEYAISHEFVIINDGSIDGTGRCLDRVRKEIKDVRVIHQLNTGHGRAVRRGYESARGKYVLQLDSNGRFEPGDFAHLWEARNGNSLVLGQRTHRLDSWVRRLFAWVLRKSASSIFGVKLNDPNVPFRLYLGTALQTALPHIPKPFHSTNLSLSVWLASQPQHSVVEVRVPYRKRPFGKNHTRLSGLASLGLTYLSEMVQLRWNMWRDKRLSLKTLQPAISN